MPQRSLLACAGITQARLIPQLEVAANRVVDVRGVYFFPGKSGSRRQKSAIRKLSVIGFDADHTFGEGKTRSRGRVGEGEGGRAR
jgi:hypothetical protein